MVIDSHVYCLPPKLTDRISAFATEEPSIWKSIFEHPECQTTIRLAHAEKVEEEMARSGVARSVLVAFPWTQQKNCRTNNDYILEQKRKNSRAFEVICSVNPFVEGWEEEVLRCKAAGAVGIKINPEWQRGKLSDSAVMALGNFCRNHKLFIMTHIDHPYKISGASPAEFCLLLSKCPETRFIAAHMGGMIGIYQLNPRVAPLFKNVWFDTAISSTLKMVTIALDLGLEDKILLGSDYPFNHSHQQKQVVDDLRAMVKDPKQFEKISHINFNRLIEA
jgi:predicted TIM-barrel fold metal-dependent hydrolase